MRTSRSHRVVPTLVATIFALFAYASPAEGALRVPAQDLHGAGEQSLAWFSVNLLAVMTAIQQDSTPPADSTKLDFGDPTNRDLPTFAPPSTSNRRSLSNPGTSASTRKPVGYLVQGKIDSMMESIRLSESVDGLDVGTAYRLGLDDYLSLRRNELNAGLRDSSANAYSLEKPLSEGEILKLLDQATNLTIPLPQSPLFGIFGKPEININVNGEVNVRAGWRWDTQNLGTASVLGQTQSSPIFNQNIQVNVNARIGDKFRLNVDWNTLNQFEFNNRFKVGYEGYDDDIVKKVEFGNVNLETNSTLIGGGQTLFGVRSDFQFGPLYIKTIASQRRGERQFINAVGGANKQFFSLRAYDYARNHFFIDTAYFAVWNAYFQSVTPVLPIEASSLVVKEIEVWESTIDLQEVQAAEAVAYADLAPILYEQGARYPDGLKNAAIKAGEVERGRFVKLEERRYEADLNLGTVTVLNLRTDRYYAVSYRIEGPTSASADDLYVGTLSRNQQERDTVILKLIARPSMQPGFPTLWSRLMKNRYNIGLSNVNVNDADISMWYYRKTNDSTDFLEGAPDKLVTIFRVDQVNNGTGATPADSKFDARPPVFNAQRGEITFPSLEPFRGGLRDYFSLKGNPQLAEQYVFDEVYDTTDVAARLNTAKDRFLIVGSASGSASGNRIPLAYNLAPGSVRVRLDGAELREGTDYTVDYYSGTLTLLNPRASLPNANLNVEYEQNDIFNLTTRTLVGMRVDYQLFKSRKWTGNIGMTLMNYDQAAVIDRVQPGQEPNSNFMMGFDGMINGDLPWLTRALDDLPFLDTKAKSSFTVSGEYAMTNPEPNKRISTVTSDNGKAVAYVDDFENARRYLNFGLTPTVWQHTAPFPDVSLWLSDTVAQSYRGRTFWYQYFVPNVPQADVYPNRARRTGQQNINPLRFEFDPAIRGIYNPNADFIDPLTPRWNDEDSLAVRSQANAFINDNKNRIWGGMTRLLSPFNTNFDNDNIDFIEIMLQIEDYEAGSKLYIDLGQISEDIIPNQRLDTEDLPPANNLMDEGEDVGLDTMSNAQEQSFYPAPLNREVDPARDDYFFNFAGDRQNQVPEDFVKYNNFENNASQSELGQFPNSEILNRNNGQTISLDNSYFRYEIILDPNPSTNPQIVGGNPERGWFQFRIPIRTPDSIIGNPLFTNIQYVRIAARGGRVKVNIADWGVVGSYWLRRHTYQSGVAEDDSVLSIAYVNREENSDAPDFYTMPPGVQPPQQLQNPDPFQQLFLNEQSLVVKVQNMRSGEERMAARTYRPWDLFFYKELAFFIHGDNTMPDNVATGATPPAYAYVRFGVDSANYYELRQPLLRGWQDIRLLVSELTAIKELRDNTRINDRQEFPSPNDAEAIYAIKGSPILTRVSYFGFGIANPTERFPNELSTTMWVDELRVVNPTDDNDWAAIGQAQFQIADIGDISANINHSTPNFHRLEERFGNRSQVTSWNVTVNGTLDKFLPKEMSNTKIPITYSHTEYAETPLFQAQNDVRLETAAEAARQDTLNKGATPEVAAAVGEDVIRRSQNVRVQDSWAITGLKLGIPTDYWLIDDTFNKIAMTFAYSQTFERSQVVAQKFHWNWNLGLNYAVSIPNKYDVSPLQFLGEVWGLKAYKDMKINFLPQSITANLMFDRGRITEQSRFVNFASPIVRNFRSEQSFGFNWRLVENGFLSPVIDYKVSSFSTLVPLEIDENGQQLTGGEVFDKMFFSEGRIVNFGNTNAFNQTFTFSMRPRLPQIANLDRLLETTASYSVTYAMGDPLQSDPATRDIVRTGRWNSQLRISPIFRWKQFGSGIFGPIKYESSEFFPTLGFILKDIFFGFENLTFNFTQQNGSTNNGIMGGTGFTNFWARTMTFRNNDPVWGPSAAYQLGFIGDPHGEMILSSSSAFPFFKFETRPGLRPPNGVMQDDYQSTSTFQFQTNRALWPGATLDLNMRSNIGYSQNQRVITDAAGVPDFTNVNKRQTIDRTFTSFPDFIGFGAFGDNVDNVIELYNERKAEILADADTSQQNTRLLDALATSFREGFESLQLFSGEAARVMPALNWTLRWDGIEKIGPFRGLATRIFLEHAYQSTYKENARINDNGRIVEMQEVRRGFQPLIGLNMTFDEQRLDGLLTATVRYNLTSAHSLASSARATIQREDSHEFQIQASYLRREMSLKFLGLDLKNDMEFTFLTQIRKSLQSRYDIDEFPAAESRTVNGTTQITIEPRARYTISNRVTASAFFRYEGNFSEGATTPGFSTTQFGVDIRLSISGGR